MKCFYLRFVLFSLLSVFIFSCSNSQNTKLINIDSDTLKKKINKIDEDVIWTKDIEPEILSDKMVRYKPHLRKRLVDRLPAPVLSSKELAG